ncbi:restriction endonuclease [Emticicia sp. 21SJ11W-3]|uniref:restriction endonuclease n=1 Tax=Emticicia sp. 21SJ11W-3 TaxID=2916755 RepID=UPI0020A1A6B6|nr:restriction endonuclease [Emticicia sp. 21SJ11W-3]UTA66535.1 NACHT domain-containing protein [Emticicia sp. 21SJ11W-3]
MTPPVSPKHNALDYHKLSWQNFERLSRDLVEKEFPTLLNVRLYLSQGHRQEGIDIRGFNPEDNKLVCIQCKQVKKLTHKDLKNIIDVFEKGDIIEQTKRFILVTKVSINRNFESELRKSEIRLNEKGILFELWDEQRLNALLKKYPKIVLDLFGVEWVKEFNGEHALEGLIFKPKRIEYACPKYYQQRVLHWIKNEGNETVQTSSIDIFNNSLEKIPNLVLIKSEATIGKSTELKFIAHYYSSVEKDVYFPVFISLKNYVNQEIPDLITKYISKWESIPKRELLLLLDGLDEVKTEERENFLKRLGQFIEANPDVTIVLSSRTNFVIQSSQLKEFEVFTLTEFSDFNMQEYASLLLSKNEVGNFLDLVDYKNIKHWLRSPFCLQHFIEFYKKDLNNIPTTRVQLIERIFDLKINKDFTRYGIDYFEQNSYLKLLERLAFAMNLLGRNSLTFNDLNEIFTSQEFEKLRKMSIVEVNDQSISFEHNILQEYLAAKVLFSFSWTDLLQAITFPPDFQKIKPKWFNTIGILLEIIPTSIPLFEPLINLIVEKESNILANIEYKFFPLPLRLKSFKKIVSSADRKYKSWEILGKNLTEFAGLNENPEVLEYLLDVVKSKDSFIRREALYCLMETNKLQLWGLENEMISIFCELLQTNEKKVVEAVIRIIIDLELIDERITEILVGKAKDKNEYWLIEDVVCYLNMSGELEKYLDIYIRAIRLFEETLQAGNGSYHFTGDSLYQGLGEIKSPESLRIILDFLLEISVDLDARQSFLNWGHYYIEELFNALFDNLFLVFNQNEEIYKKILQLFLNSSCYQKNKTTKCFLVFMIKSKSKKEVFWDIWDEHKSGKQIWKLDFNGLLDNQLLQDCIHNFQNRTLSKEDLWYIIHITNDSNHEWSEQLRLELNSISNNYFVYIEQKNWEEERLIKTQKDFYLLLNRNQFKNCVLEVFERFAKDNFNRSEFDGDRRNWQLEDNNIIGDFLRSFFSNEIQEVRKSQVFNWIDNDTNWNSYIIEEFHRLLHNDISFPCDALEYLQTWCNENVENLIFRTAIIENEDFSWSYRYLELYYADFFLNLGISVPEEILLDMLSFIVVRDSFEKSKGSKDERTFIEKIASLIGFDKAKNKILENLQNESQPLIVTDLQVQWCTKFNCIEAIPLIKSILEKKHSKNCIYLESIFKNYLKLGGKVVELRFIFNVFDSGNEFHWSLLEQMVKVDIMKPRVGNTILKIRKSESLHKASLILIEANFIEGLEWYANWLKSLEDFRNHRNDFIIPLKGIDLLPVDRSIVIFVDLIKFVLNNKIYERDRFEPINILFDSLKLIALKSDEIFLEVFKKLNSIDISEIDKINTSIFKDRLFSLEREYYLQKIDYKNIKEIKPILEKIFA